jgi:hypothetical protein
LDSSTFSFRFEDINPTNTGAESVFSQSFQSKPSSLETNYLSTVDLSDVLGSLLPKPVQQQTQVPINPAVPSVITSAGSLPLPLVPQATLSAVPLSDEWEYLDPQSAIQGPFTLKSMRRWLESGYFKPDLPIRLRAWSKFHPLGIVYPNLDHAFLQLLPEPTAGKNPILSGNMELNSGPAQLADQRKQQVVEQQRQQLAERQRQQPIFEQHIQQPLSLAEQQKTDYQRQQEQLAIMAEVQRRQSQQYQPVAVIQPPVQMTQQKLEQRVLREQQLIQEKRQKSAKSSQNASSNSIEGDGTISHKSDVSDGIHKVKVDNLSPIITSTQSSTHWGGVAIGKPTQKSLSEIQFEEERSLQRQQQQAIQSGDTNMSNKLKSLLGLSSNINANVTGSASTNIPTKVWATDLTGSGSGSGSGKTGMSAKSLKEIQLEDQQEIFRQQQLLAEQKQQLQRRLQQNVKMDTDMAAIQSSVTPSWADQSVSSKSKLVGKAPSLKDIMKNEVEIEPDEAVRGSGNTWVSKIVVSPSLPPNFASKPSVSPTANTNKSSEASLNAVATQPTDSKKSTDTKSGVNGSGKQTNRSEFGGKGMSPELKEFCVASMKKLNGADDITLLEFCMTLSSGAEIREYLSSYLGSKPEVVFMLAIE